MSHRDYLERQGDTFTYHTASLPSEMYTYYYLTNGKKMLDPENSRVTRDIDLKLNFFFVEGDVADYYLDKGVPHGKIDKVWYPSTLNGMSQRRMFVYTPPGYDSEGEDTYPVLYLTGNNISSWFGKYEKLFVHEIVKYTERHYRVKTDKQHRAIAGLSMGGLHT